MYYIIIFQKNYYTPYHIIIPFSFSKGNTVIIKHVKGAGVFVGVGTEGWGWGLGKGAREGVILTSKEFMVQ